MSEEKSPGQKEAKLSDGKKVLFKGEFLTLIREGHWEYAERINSRGAAIIVAVTSENKLLLVEQYRIPLGARTIELPAGISGDSAGAEDEALAEAARRELLEETGYNAKRIEPLTCGAASSGMSSEMVTLFRATKLSRLNAGGGHAGEGITVHEVPVPEAHAWLENKARAGLLIDPKIYAGLYFLLLGQERNPG